MKFIKTIVGRGILMADAKPFGPCEFALEVQGDENKPRTCTGTLSASHESLLRAFSAAKVSIIRNDTTFEMRITISDYNGGSGEVAVRVSGPTE